MKKQKNLFLAGSAALISLVAIGSVATASLAASDENGFSFFPGKGSKGNLSEEEKDSWIKEREEWKEDLVLRRDEFKQEREQIRVSLRSEAIQNAINSGDFQSWQEAIGDNCPLSDRLGEEEFSQLENHEDFKQEMRKIKEEMGMEKGFGRNKSSGFQGKNSR